MAYKPTGRPRGRPPKNRAPDPEEAAFVLGDDDLVGAPLRASTEKTNMERAPDLALVAGGVSAAWLAHVFGMDKNTIKKKLAQCPVAGMNKATPLYRIKDAAAWLIPPKVDVMSYIRGMNPSDLPPRLNDAYWSAMGRRQKVLQDAGDLWRTADVLGVFGEAAIKIKSTVQLWVDEVDRVHGISDAQREMLTRMADGLLENIHEIFVTAPQGKKRTRSTLAIEHPGEQDDLDEDDDDLI